jgi:hypothetical protein
MICPNNSQSLLLPLASGASEYYSQLTWNKEYTHQVSVAIPWLPLMGTHILTKNFAGFRVATFLCYFVGGGFDLPCSIQV